MMRSFYTMNSWMSERKMGTCGRDIRWKHIEGGIRWEHAEGRKQDVTLKCLDKSSSRETSNKELQATHNLAANWAAQRFNRSSDSGSIVCNHISILTHVWSRARI